MVGFSRNLRTIGETAEAQLTSNPSNTVTNLTALLHIENQEELEAQRCRWSHNWRFSVLFPENDSQLVVPLKFGDKRHLMRPNHVLSTLLRRLCVTVLENHEGSVPCEQAIGSSGAEELLDKMSVCLAVPDHFTLQQAERILEGAALAGIKRAECIRHSDAILEQWAARNLPEFYDVNAAKHSKEENSIDVENTPSVYVCLIDIGYAQTNCQICRVYREDVQGDSVEKPVARVEVASRMTDAMMGSVDFETSVRDHVKSIIMKQHPTFLANVEPSSKIMYRLGQACEKLTRDLSALPDSTIDIEAFAEDEDLHVKLSREALEQVCSSYKERLVGLIKNCIADVSSKDPAWKGVAGIDIVGGATRIPWVQQTILKVFGPLLLTNGEPSGGPVEKEKAVDNGSGGPLRRSMDGSSAVAGGAALWASGIRSRKGVWSAALSVERTEPAIAELKVLEKEMACIEILENQRLSMRNNFEAYILKMQAVLNSKDRHLVETVKAEELLRDADNWFIDRPFPDDTLYNEYLSKFEQLERDLAEPFKKYFESIEAEKQRFETELAKSAKAAAADGRDEDPDTKLPAGQCLKRAQKNKEEGSELLAGGSTEMAAMRYVKALQFVAKLRDASPEQKEEGNALALSCNLNLAQCYLKLNAEATNRKAVSCCNAVLELDSHNEKAMYRKAVALERMKDYEQARKVIEGCLSDDQKDADVLNLRDLIDKQLKQQEAKTKKMYAKMFS
eukprot:GHVS01002189.1.p1 GENE.GHVS01002189.1~~GHVS01002189.1.p1  ORF type:complete len:807 (+),score=108.83 GHVS01002189.1:223-2421(+)